MKIFLSIRRKYLLVRSHKEILRLADAIDNINTIKLPVNIAGHMLLPQTQNSDHSTVIGLQLDILMQHCLLPRVPVYSTGRCLWNFTGVSGPFSRFHPNLQDPSLSVAENDKNCDEYKQTNAISAYVPSSFQKLVVILKRFFLLFKNNRQCISSEIMINISFILL